jgi:hypothetical protein
MAPERALPYYISPTVHCAYRVVKQHNILVIRRFSYEPTKISSEIFLPLGVSSQRYGAALLCAGNVPYQSPFAAQQPEPVTDGCSSNRTPNFRLARR